MDEETRELRDLFVDVTETDTVTTEQAADRGSLVESPSGDVAGLASIVETMQERYDFSTDLSIEDLCRVVTGYVRGQPDRELARALDTDRSTIRRARLDLHCWREDDVEDLSLDRLRSVRDGADSTAAIVGQLDVSEATVERACQVLMIRDRARRANYRFRRAFVDQLTDAALSQQLTAGVREDGLAGALEDAEIDVKF